MTLAAGMTVVIVFVAGTSPMRILPLTINLIIATNLKQGELLDELETWKIDGWQYHDFIDSKTGRTESKVLISFEGDDERLCLNLTNGNTLRKLFGNSMNSWVGKWVTLYQVETNLGPGIRIRQATKKEIDSVVDRE
jgi:hypothetical protein